MKKKPFMYKYLPKEYEVIEDQEPTGKTEFSFVKFTDEYIETEKMIKKSKEMNCYFGIAEAEYLLDHQDKIPKELQDNYIVFPATILRSPGGDLYVPYLYFDGDRWVLVFRWESGDWGSRGRFAKCESVTQSLGHSDTRSLKEIIDCMGRDFEELKKLI